MEIIKSNYAVLKGDNIFLYNERPTIRPYSSELIKDVEIIIKDGLATLNGDLIMFGFTFDGFYLGERIDIENKEISLRFNLFKLKKEPYVKSGWFQLKQTEPYFLTTNKFKIIK